jgi:hypothetical protein
LCEWRGREGLLWLLPAFVGAPAGWGTADWRKERKPGRDLAAVEVEVVGCGGLEGEEASAARLAYTLLTSSW